MADHLTQFIISRIVADYIRLRDQGFAPLIDDYAQFWPEDSRQLLTPLLLEEFRYRTRKNRDVRIETLTREYPNLIDNGIIIQLLELELRLSPQDPDRNEISARFPQLSENEVEHVVEQVLFYKVWHQDDHKETVRRKPAVQQDEAPEETAKFIRNEDTDVAAIPDRQEGTEAFTPPSVQTDSVPEDSTAVFTPPADDVATPISVQEEATAVYAPSPTKDIVQEEGTAVFVPPPAKDIVPEDGTAVFDFNVPQLPSSPIWGEGKTPTINWDNEAMASSLDQAREHYRKVAGEVADESKAASLSTAPQRKGALDGRQREFNVRDTVVVEEYIGSGAWKDVYKARQKSTRQLVAFKHLREKNDQEREALIKEVRTQAQLTHQNIPPVFSFDLLDNGQAIVVEKLVNGSRWSDSMTTRTLDDNLRILLEVAQAVAYAHRRHDLIHRDLKPDNVVVNDEFDEVYLIDWGLAVSVAPEPPEDRESSVHISDLVGIAGTPLYWAPEMARGEISKFSPASDVFLLGALLYEVLTHHPPYDLFPGQTTVQLNTVVATSMKVLEVGPMLRSIRGVIFPPKIRAPELFIPDELAVIAMKAMAPEPKDRYADAGLFVDAIKRYQDHAEATLRCDAAWKSLHLIDEEIKASETKNVRKLHPLTLRLIELSDIFHQVYLTLAEEDEADNTTAPNNLTSSLSNANLIGVDDPLEPAIKSARLGEKEARQRLFDLTLRTGDLTLATAQLDLLTKNPYMKSEDIRSHRRRIDALHAVRRRAKTMKWVAVALLLAFLGSSVVYGHLINVQFQKTEAQRKLAEANFQKARDAVKRFYTMFAKDESVKNAGLMKLQRELFDAAKEYNEDFVAQKSDDPEVLYDQMHALFDIGKIETYFGNHEEAISYYKRAVDLGNRLVEEKPEISKYRDLLAKTYKDIGIVYETVESDPDIIIDVNLKALDINRKLVEEYPDVLDYRRNLARILHNMGLLNARWDPTSPETEKFYLESLSVRERLQTEDPTEYLFGKSQTLSALATFYFAEADFAEMEAEEFRERENTVKAEQAERTKAKHLNNVQKILADALELLRTLEKEYPDDGAIDRKFLYGFIRLEQGKAFFKNGSLPEAEKTLLDAAETFENIVEKAPEHLSYQGRLFETRKWVYQTFLAEEKFKEMEELCYRCKKDATEAREKYPHVTDYLLFWGDWSLNLANTWVDLGKVDEAAKLLKESMAELDAILKTTRFPEMAEIRIEDIRATMSLCLEILEQGEPATDEPSSDEPPSDEP